MQGTSCRTLSLTIAASSGRAISLCAREHNYGDGKEFTEWKQFSLRPKTACSQHRRRPEQKELRKFVCLNYNFTGVMSAHGGGKFPSHLSPRVVEPMFLMEGLIATGRRGRN